MSKLLPRKGGNLTTKPRMCGEHRAAMGFPMGFPSFIDPLNEKNELASECQRGYTNANIPMSSAPHIKRNRLGETVWYEEEILQELLHSNIISCYGSSPCGTELMLESADHDLYQHIKNADGLRLPEDEVLRIAMHIGNALAHIHNKGFSHNDIKVENIVLVMSTDKTYIPKIIDFEFAHRKGAVPPNGSDTIAGTQAYNSPEKGAAVVGHCRQKADMWSLGITLYLASVGCFPNGTSEALPILENDFLSTRAESKLSVLLEGLLTVDPEVRWSASDISHHLWSL